MVERLVFTAFLLASRVALFNIPVACEPLEKSHTEIRKEESQEDKLRILVQNGTGKKQSIRIFRRRMPNNKLFGPKSLLGIDTIQLEPMQSRVLAYDLVPAEYLEISHGKNVLKQLARWQPDFSLICIGKKRFNHPLLQEFRKKVGLKYGFIQQNV